MAQIYGGLYLYIGPYHGIKGIKTSQVKALYWHTPVLWNQAQDAHHFEVNKDYMENSRPVWTIV